MGIFNVISLFGGLAMFLYGMRLMGDGLKEGSSGALKKVMERVTNNHFKSFLLGVAVTALIQSSTATIVITSGLVGAGILSLNQALGIIIGANVGTTVTGQIIRLLDISSSAGFWLQFLRPSTLAPIALIFGIVLIMGFKFKNARMIGNIAIGFGILFSGLLNMTSAVSVLSDSGYFERIFTSLNDNALIGYLTGAAVAFTLQSSSATIGILQALSISGRLNFHSIYPVLLGIYLGDCVTTAIVCSIGAKPDARRIGIVHVQFNFCETALIFIVVNLLRSFGLLSAMEYVPLNSGGIANVNTVFNLGCALALFPLLNTYERISRKVIRDEPEIVGKYAEKLGALSPAFFSTPALAFRSCYDLLLCMFYAAKENINKAFAVIRHYDEALCREIEEEEANIDLMADRISQYLVSLSPNIVNAQHAAILDQYYKVVIEFERLGDHAVNIAEQAETLHKEGLHFSDTALDELMVLKGLIDSILDNTEQAFKFRDETAAQHIEPLEEVVDDMVSALKDNHVARLRDGKCSVYTGTSFLNLLVDIERISDVCSNVGVATVARVEPELANKAHDYISSLHMGNNDSFNREYESAHEAYFKLLDRVEEEDKDKAIIERG